MNFYSFHIGDYSSATRHLSWDEDMAYRRLLDAYYMREGPLPADKRQVYRLVVATSKAQREAVDVVLEEFFSLSDAGWSNQRCDEELASVRIKREKATASAKHRWSNANASENSSERNANASADAMRTHSEGNAPITHYPLPTPYPSKDIGEVVTRARGGDLELLLRQAAGWEREPAPKLAVTGPIEALLDAGADLDLDVLPTVSAIAPAAESRTSWNYFVKAIARARDTRLAAGTLKTRPKHGPANRNDRSNLTELVKYLGDRQAASDADPAG